MNKVEEYINSHWNECIKENMEDNDTLIGLPYPYVIPAVGHFDEMYYWDTYFTNKGLECSNMNCQSKNNVDNMLYLVNKYGFMPNGNRTYYLNCSQPPFLSEMVKDVYNYYHDKAWLEGAYINLLKEYDFWMTKRMSKTGLNIHNGDIEESEYSLHAGWTRERIGETPGVSDEQLAKHSRVMSEIGWDFTPRFGFDGPNFNPIDLNSLLYGFEKNMEFFSKELGKNDEEIWDNRSINRRKLMEEYLLDSDGLFKDYNFVTNKKCEIFSIAQFYPLYVGLASKEQARRVMENINKVESEFGLFTCEKNSNHTKYQWDYPNGWACLQYIAVKGMQNYGYYEDAKRIADKYIKLVDKVFDETGAIWEKYNVLEGNIEVGNEYEMPKMMGWSAGVYLALKQFLKTGNI